MWQDTVRTVAGSTIGHVHVSGAALETVITINIGAEPPPRDAVFFVKDDRFMTRCAGGLGHMCRADRRARVRG